MAVEERGNKVKTSRELGFGEPQVGYESDAGLTPPGDPQAGRWTVRRQNNSWAVVFHSFKGHGEHIIQTFPPTEDGERAAKTMALKLVDLPFLQ